MDRPRRAVILGSGRVAGHMARAMSQILRIEQIWTRTPGHASALASQVGAQEVNNISQVVRDADLYLISVSDDAVADVSRDLGRVKGIVAHTSGSIPLHALHNGERTENCAVFYPLQTFSATRPASLEGIPLFIEADSGRVADTLTRLAEEMGMKPMNADSHMRARIHLAAVWACNFANMMWAEAEDILGKEGLTLNLLEPLLKETLHKALTDGAKPSQTGPAARHDTGVIKKQEEALDHDARELYHIISRKIMQSHPLNHTDTTSKGETDTHEQN